MKFNNIQIEKFTGWNLWKVNFAVKQMGESEDITIVTIQNETERGKKMNQTEQNTNKLKDNFKCPNG